MRIKTDRSPLPGRRALLATALLLCIGSFASSASSAAETVLVTGATGQTGRLLVPVLTKNGLSVRAMVRSAESAAKVPAGVQTVIADVTDPPTLKAAVTGASTVISTLGARFPIGSNGFEAVDWEGNRALIDAAKAAGVRHFISVVRRFCRPRRVSVFLVDIALPLEGQV